jgi:hypothetical protein
MHSALSVSLVATSDNKTRYAQYAFTPATGWVHGTLLDTVTVKPISDDDPVVSAVNNQTPVAEVLPKKSVGEAGTLRCTQVEGQTMHSGPCSAAAADIGD